MAEISLTGVNKIYPDGTHAVHDVDLHIADGEFMIMVGPSGCAKSTILRMIAGLEKPTSGTVDIGGRVVNDVAPKDRDIAMVFQSYALYPHMTVRDNMAFGLRLRRMPDSEIDQRVADAARILGLEQLLDRLPKAMSGGQRQRVAMGRAIVREPQAFLMDEPLSNLDAKLRVQMRTEIAKLHQRLQTTTVYVTHDQVEAMTLGQRICILRKGIIQQVDTPFEVYNNPANVFVGGFIGSPGMNFMSGHLVLHEGILYLRLGEHHLPLPASVTSRLLASNDIHGRGVIVGIRPEHLSLAAPGDSAALPVNVELVEAMGAETYAYITAAVATPDLSALSDTQASAACFVARLSAGATARSGEEIWLRPDLDEVHLFDPQTMLTMLAPSDENEVRARQAGLATTAAAELQGRQSPVAAPPAATVVQPVQPVIHLHQTFLRPETAPAAHAAPVPGATIDADPAAIAAVFDQPVAPPMALEPLMPAPAAARPSFGDQVAAGSSLHAPEPAHDAVPAPQRRGFAPRPIASVVPAPAQRPEPPRERADVLRATPGELDDAIQRTAELPAATTAPSPFRAALAQMQSPSGIPGPAAAARAVLPPRVSLRPAASDSPSEIPAFRVPRLDGAAEPTGT